MDIEGAIKLLGVQRKYPPPRPFLSLSTNSSIPSQHCSIPSQLHYFTVIKTLLVLYLNDLWMFSFPTKDTSCFCQHLIRIWVSVWRLWSSERMCGQLIDSADRLCMGYRWERKIVASQSHDVIGKLSGSLVSIGWISEFLSSDQCALFMCWWSRWQGFYGYQDGVLKACGYIQTMTYIWNTSQRVELHDSQ